MRRHARTSPETTSRATSLAALPSLARVGVPIATEEISDANDVEIAVAHRWKESDHALRRTRATCSGKRSHARLTTVSARLLAGRMKWAGEKADRGCRS